MPGEFHCKNLSWRIPEQDCDLIRTFYEQTPHDGVDLDSNDFVQYIDNLVHWEYLTTLYLEGRTFMHGNKRYKDHIGEEVYFQGRREEDAGGDNNRIWNKDGEQRRRELVLRGLVNNAIDYYRNVGWNFKSTVDWGERKFRPFRCDLSEWKEIPDTVN